MTPRQLLAPIERLVREPAVYARYSRNARQRIDAIYRIELTVAHYHDLYTEIRKPEPDPIPITTTHEASAEDLLIRPRCSISERPAMLTVTSRR